MAQMKDSGIEWNERIPSVWKIGRVKYIFYLSKAKANETNPTILRLAREGIQIRDISTNVGQLAESYSDYNPVKPNDLLLNTMDLISGANCSISKISGVISPAYANLRPTNNDICSKYYDYYFKLQYWSMAFFAHGKGISYDNRWTLNSESLLNYPIFIPPTEEQIAISNFLDNKSTEIKSLIDNLNKQIESLKDYKKEIISETVTKGLDPNVPLKDSGIDWIGKMPSRWSRNKLLHIFKIIGSGTTPNSGYDDYFDGTINWIQSGDIHGKHLTTCKNKLKEECFQEYSALKFYVHPFIIVAMYGASIGNISISTIDACVNQACCVLSDSTIDNEFAYYAISAANNYLLYKAVGSGQPNINQAIIRNLIIPLPSIKEQNRIAIYLDGKCSKIERVISLKQQTIDKLNEYSKSLIYEYVTGKKEIPVNGTDER